MTHLHRTLHLSLLLLLLCALAAPAAHAQGGGNFDGLTIPINGTFTDATGAIGTFAGNFQLQRFALDGGNVVAVGTLTGTLTNAAGGIIGTVLRTVSLVLDLDGLNASCEILHLELGPLDLDLLGLVVHLDQVVLDISAEPGSGNLLGNLLCAVTHLLDGSGALSRLVETLNQIIQLL